MVELNTVFHAKNNDYVKDFLYIKIKSFYWFKKERKKSDPQNLNVISVNDNTKQQRDTSYMWKLVQF